jgi:hypothetical protein
VLSLSCLSSPSIPLGGEKSVRMERLTGCGPLWSSATSTGLGNQDFYLDQRHSHKRQRTVAHAWANIGSDVVYRAVGSSCGAPQDQWEWAVGLQATYCLGAVDVSAAPRVGASPQQANSKCSGSLCEENAIQTASLQVHAISDAWVCVFTCVPVRRCWAQAG